MMWKETPLSKRLEEQAKKAAAAEEEAKQKAQEAGAATDTVAVPIRPVDNYLMCKVIPKSQLVGQGCQPHCTQDNFSLAFRIKRYAMDQVKKILAGAQKNIFWIVSGLTVVVGIVGYWLSRSSMDKLFVAQSTKIDGQYTTLN